MAMATSSKEKHLHAHTSRSEVVEYRLTMALAYVFFLVVAIVNRLMPKRWRANLAGLDGKRSVFSEARIAASTCIPFAYK